MGNDSYFSAKYWIDLMNHNKSSICILKDEQIGENTLLLLSTKETVGEFCGSGYGGEWSWSNDPLKLMEYVKEIHIRLAIIEYFDMMEDVDISPYFENVGVKTALKAMINDPENYGVIEWASIINNYLWWIDELEKMIGTSFNYNKVKKHFTELNDSFAQNEKCITKLMLFKNYKEALPELKAHNCVEISDDIQKMFLEDCVC